jgi:ABC-2 type transport system permease protein
MRPTLHYIRMEIFSAMSGRADVFLYVISSMASPMVMLAIWFAVNASGGHLPLSSQVMVNYYIYLFVIELWNSAWHTPFISANIRYGRLTPYLLKPMSYFSYQLGGNIGEKVMKTTYLFPIILILGILLKVQIPQLDVFGWGMFILSWILSAIMMFCMSCIIGVTTFWLDESSSFDNAFDLFYFVFSGRTFPLVMLPFVMQGAAQILPFRYMLSLPVEIVSGLLSTTEMLKGLAIQGFWVVFFLLALKLLWQIGVRKYSAVGA